MKALNVRQPWAWMIACGYKTIETRTWSTKYRGDILIVASKKRMSKVTEKAFIENTGYRLFEIEYGAGICVADLFDCRIMTGEDEPLACCDLYKGAFAWYLRNIRHISPFPVKGRLGLYDIEVENQC